MVWLNFWLSASSVANWQSVAAGGAVGGWVVFNGPNPLNLIGRKHPSKWSCSNIAITRRPSITSTLVLDYRPRLTMPGTEGNRPPKNLDGSPAADGTAQTKSAPSDQETKTSKQAL